MGRILKSDKRAPALIFVACLAGLSVLMGLYLILVQDAKTKAGWSASVGSLYFMQSGRQGFSGKAADYFLDKAYDAHMQALRLSPYDPSLWVHMSYVLVDKYEDPAQALKALDIAQQLSPSQSGEIASHRDKILGQTGHKKGAQR